MSLSRKLSNLILVLFILNILAVVLLKGGVTAQHRIDPRDYIPSGKTTPDELGWNYIGSSTGGRVCIDLADYGIRQVRFFMILNGSNWTGRKTRGADPEGVTVLHAQDPKYDGKIGANAIVATYFAPLPKKACKVWGVCWSSKWCLGGKVKDLLGPLDKDVHGCSLGHDPEPLQFGGDSGYAVIDIACGDEETCKGIMNETDCDNAPECGWNEKNGNCTHGCAKFDNKTDCVGTDLCYWKESAQECRGTNIRCSSVDSEENGRLIVDRPGDDFCTTESGEGEPHRYYVFDYYDDPWMMTAYGDAFINNGVDGMSLYEVGDTRLEIPLGTAHFSTFIASNLNNNLPRRASRRDYTLTNYPDENKSRVGERSGIYPLYDYIDSLWKKNQPNSCTRHDNVLPDKCPSGKHIYFIDDPSTRELSHKWFEQDYKHDRACVIVSKGSIQVPKDPDSIVYEVFINRDKWVRPKNHLLDAYFFLDGEFIADFDMVTLEVNGGVIAKNVDFDRNVFGDLNNPSEVMRYDPKYLVLLNDCLGTGENSFVMREYRYH